jgi:hypothetical protein
VLSGYYEGARGASIEFIDENNAIMGTSATINTPDQSVDVSFIGVLHGVTYTFEGNQITFYAATNHDGNKVSELLGYGTISDNNQEIVFYGDIYTKK